MEKVSKEYGGQRIETLSSGRLIKWTSQRLNSYTAKRGDRWSRGCVMETVPFGVSKFILCSGTMQPKFEKSF